MKKRLKKIGALLLAGVLTIANMCVGDRLLYVEAAKVQCTFYEGYNTGDQNYIRWSKPITSYLEVLSETQFMRVQAGALDAAYLVEYYDAEYNIQSTKIVEQELPIFGGFYAMGSNYYILSGQVNFQENPEIECYRITKYDKNWNRISYVGLYDCNTTVPFDAGSARFAQCGKYLLIRTSHEMYKADDGYNHQANVTIQVDTEAMSITDSYTQVMNNGHGYVSHSFNQFIQVEDNHIIAVDHGDAHPRSLVLMKYKTDVTTGKFTPSYSNKCQVIDLVNIQGQIGDNITGASVGGFEISESAYLTAFNSIDQENGTLSDETRNIFVAVCDKEDSTVIIRQITNFAEGEVTTTTPHLVKISDNEFIVLWSRNNQVSYVKIDGEGKQLGDICYIEAAQLSDCVPVVLNNQLVWYTWNDEEITFYGINLNDTTQNERTVIKNGHEWELIYPESGSNVCVRDCLNCDYSDEIKVSTSYSVYWNTDGGYQYSTGLETQRTVGDILKFWISNNDNEAENTEFVISVSDESLAEIIYTNGKELGEIHCKRAGEFTITVAPKYNLPEVKTFKITVTGSNETPTPTVTEEVTLSPTATEEVTPSPTATEEVTPSPTATEEVTPSPTATEEVTPNPTATEEVTPSPTVTEEVTPSPTVTEEVPPSPTETEDVENVFSDVHKDWYKDYVQYVYDHKLMTGMKGSTQFQPNANITKAQVAQVLYNMENQPKVEEAKVFAELTDVYAGEWYANAVAWAYNTGVVTGDLTTKKFNPNADVTREQLALMMFRYAKYKEYDVSASGDLAGLKNAGNTSDWALDGVKWAVGSGLISGVDKNGVKDLQPRGNASRAQVAAILKRFCESYK